MNTPCPTPPPSRLSSGVLLPAGPWTRIMRHADRLGLDAEQLLDLALDCFDEHGDDWIEAQRWNLSPAETSP